MQWSRWMNVIDIVKNINYAIENEYHMEIKNQEYIKLIEKDNGGYEFHIELANPQKNHFLVIQNLNELKKNAAAYIKNPPKDCDYIMLDLNLKKIIFIELKDRESFTKKRVVEQIEAGEKWLEHLLFCSDLPNLMEDTSWAKFWVALNYRENKRPARKTQYKDLIKDTKRPLPVYEGNNFILESLLIRL